MDQRQAVGWLHRRAGLGLHPTALAAAIERGPEVELARLVAPPDTLPDPWDGLALDPQDGGRPEAVRGWIEQFFTSEVPYVDRRTWILHGWLVSSMGKVGVPELMVEQIRLYMRDGGGSYPELLRAVTTDRAMLGYLDGRTSTGDAPNENYGRELMELFALGVGNYTEDDVLAAARALTGWVIRPRTYEAIFVPRRHDDTPQTLLGVDGVHDVDTVIDAVVGHPAHPEFVANRIAAEYLGATDDPDVIADLAAVYTSSGMRLDPVITRSLELGLDGASTPMVLGPFPWLVITVRALGLTLRQAAAAAGRGIRDIGQVPLFPPSVAGWPTGTEWFTSSSLIARTNIAAGLAGAASPDEPLRVAAEDGDADRLAELLGLPEPFGPATAATLAGAANPVSRLTLALVSPENLLS